jgi:hypothetical protein
MRFPTATRNCTSSEAGSASERGSTSRTDSTGSPCNATESRDGQGATEATEGPSALRAPSQVTPN